MGISPQLVRCIHGASTPEASSVWDRGSLTPVSPNIFRLSHWSRWSRLLQGGNRALPSPCLGVCLAGAEMTVDSSDWETGQVRKEQKATKKLRKKAAVFIHFFFFCYMHFFCNVKTWLITYYVQTKIHQPPSIAWSWRKLFTFRAGRTTPSFWQRLDTEFWRQRWHYELQANKLIHNNNRRCLIYIF